MASSNSSSRSSNNLVVPQARAALEQMKYEIAQQLGISLSQDGYYGNLLTKEAGSIGGQITRRLVQMAEQQLSEAGGNSGFSGR